MSLQKRLSPSTLFRLGMACLVIGPILPRVVHPATPSGANLLDGIHGLMLGLALGFLFLFFRTKRFSIPK
jgi:hypothetical protein